MSMGGGKGGGASSTVTLPPNVERAVDQMLKQASYINETGYSPYLGPTGAVLTPEQENAMRATNTAMQAFGLAPQGTYDPTAGLPEAQDFGGVMGYSPIGIYDQARAAELERSPALVAHREAQFIDPVTGAAPEVSFRYVPPPQPFMGGGQGYTEDYSGGGGEELNFTGGSVGTGNFFDDLSAFGGGLLDLATGDDRHDGWNSVSSIDSFKQF